MKQAKNRQERARLRRIGKKTRFKKGQSGNPAGRPPDMFSPRSCLKHLAGVVVTVKVRDEKTGIERLIQDPKGRTFAQVVASALAKKASAGNIKAIEVFFKQIYGEVPQTFDIKAPPSEDGSPAGVMLVVGGTERTYVEALREARKK